MSKAYIQQITCLSCFPIKSLEKQWCNPFLYRGRLREPGELNTSTGGTASAQQNDGMQHAGIIIVIKMNYYSI